MHTLTAALETIENRGPFYAVFGTNHRGEAMVSLELTAEDAEKTFDSFTERDYRDVKIHPPGDFDLAALGRAYADAARKALRAKASLRAGVLRALDAKRAEAEVARTAGVDRGTVRKWAGK